MFKSFPKGFKKQTYFDIATGQQLKNWIVFLMFYAVAFI